MRAGKSTFLKLYGSACLTATCIEQEFIGLDARENDIRVEGFFLIFPERCVHFWIPSRLHANNSCDALLCNGSCQENGIGGHINHYGHGTGH